MCVCGCAHSYTCTSLHPSVHLSIPSMHVCMYTHTQLFSCIFVTRIRQARRSLGKLRSTTTNTLVRQLIHNQHHQLINSSLHPQQFTSHLAIGDYIQSQADQFACIHACVCTHAHAHMQTYSTDRQTDSQAGGQAGLHNDSMYACIHIDIWIQI